MTDEERDRFDDFFADFLAKLAPSQRHALGGLLRYRQGADPRDWASAGAVRYAIADWMMQAGTGKWTGTARSSGAVEVTFPAAFSGTPIVLATAINTTPLFQDARLQAAIASAASMEVYWWSSAALTRLDFCWLALGPIGL